MKGGETWKGEMRGDVVDDLRENGCGVLLGGCMDSVQVGGSGGCDEGSGV